MFRIYEIAISTFSARQVSRARFKSIRDCDFGRTRCSVGIALQRSSIIAFNRTRDRIALSLCVWRRAIPSERPVRPFSTELWIVSWDLHGRPGRRRWAGNGDCGVEDKCSDSKLRTLRTSVGKHWSRVSPARDALPEAILRLTWVWLIGEKSSDPSSVMVVKSNTIWESTAGIASKDEKGDEDRNHWERLRGNE